MPRSGVSYPLASWFLVAAVFALSACDRTAMPMDASSDEGPSDDMASDVGEDFGVEDADANDLADTLEDGGESVDLALFFVGNSYTHANDLPGMVDRSLLSLSPPRSAAIGRSNPGGYRLTQHAADATNEDHPLAMGLSDGGLTHLVLQEQSQIPGFGDGNAEFELSKAGAFELAQRADGARVVMYVTWGRRDGDAGNPGLFPDFIEMQDRLDAGYQSLAAEAERAGAEVALAPVGPGFRAVWQEESEVGDPHDPSSLFFRLYSGDGSHPSVLGTYLAACVLAGTLAEVDASEIEFVPDGVEVEDARRIRAAADVALGLEHSE